MHWNTPSKAQKKSSEILNRLIELAKKYHVVDSFTLRKAKSEAESLIPIDAAAAHLVLGVIACLEGDVAELHRRHRLAIELSPDQLFAVSQYAVSLSRLSLFDEAAEQMEVVVESMPESKSALGMLIATCYRAGRLQAAERWLSVWHKRFPDTKHEQEPLIQQTLDFARQHDVSDDDLAVSIREAVDLVVERNVPQGSWEGGLSADDDEKWIAYRLRLFAKPAEVADLGERLADRYAGLELNPASSSHFSVGYAIESWAPHHGGNA